MYVIPEKKSVMFATIAALALGPFGLMYVSIGGGVLLIVLVLLFAVSLGAGGIGGATLGLLAWVISFIAAPLVALDHNSRVKRLEREREMMLQRLQAGRHDHLPPMS
jgi:hypothetical protein